MAKAIEKVVIDQAENIPFNLLDLSQKNVRQVKNGVTIPDLAGDIALRGLLQSLNVRPKSGEDGKETGRYEVPAGGRRYRALELLIKQKRMSKTQPVPCVVKLSGSTSMEDDSLAENVHREVLHPLDQFRTYKTLRDQGLDIEEIAARNLVTPAFVKQRLKLASVSPKLLALYEQGEIKLEVVMAFSITDDHARQEQAWERVSGLATRDPAYIKRLLTETTVHANDRRAVYVGPEAYEAAGGIIMRDLFDADSGGWFQDAALLEQLVFEKLKADAKTIQAEGWKWVEAGISFPYGHTSGMRRIYAEPQDMTAEELERYDALNAELEKLEAEYDEAPDYDEEVESKLEQLQTQIDALNVRPYVYDPEEVPHAGVFVTLGANGQLNIERGFVRPEDEPQEEEAGDDAAENAADGEEVNGHDHGGNTVVVNGKAAGPDDDDEPEDPVIRPLPEALIYDLTAQRTLALRNALAVDSDIAFVAALHAFVLQRFYNSTTDSCLEVTVKTDSFAAAKDLKETPWAKEIAERHDGWGKDLPKKRDDLWDFLLGLDEASKKALFAHCVSLSLNAVNEKYNRRPQARLHADTVAATLQFDMVSAGWTPTAENYFSRVTKARIVEAVSEGKGARDAYLMAHLPKGEMVTEAERLLANSGWLPELLRDPGYSVAASAPQAEAAAEAEEDDGADLPAYLTEDAGASQENLEPAE